MNERINELAEQARSWAEEAYNKQNNQFTSRWDTPIGHTPSQFFEQKFAELLIHECIVTIQRGITRDGHNTEKYLRSMTHIKQIKEHFGVEK